MSDADSYGLIKNYHQFSEKMGHRIDALYLRATVDKKLEEINNELAQIKDNTQEMRDKCV